jgi:hypothetical protein
VPYAALWFLTGYAGLADVRRTVLATMQIPPNSTDISDGRNEVVGPVHYCTVRAYAPFLVRADYGWQRGKLSGDGGSALYVWIYGFRFRLRELDHWMS